MEELLGRLPAEVAPWATAALIFAARISDVTLGTLRIIAISRGQRALAPVFGFFEVLIWLLAMSQVVQNLSDVRSYLAWAGGFAVGTWVGIAVEARMAMGLVAVRIITDQDASELMETLNRADYGVTSVAARGIAGRVRLLFTVIQRKDLGEVTAIVRQHHPGAFVSVGDVREASAGIFRRGRFGGQLADFFRRLRKER